MRKALTLSVLMIFLGSCTPRYPSDSEMIHHLESNISEFEALLTMFENDGMSVVHPTWIQPKGKITSERWDQYKSIFDKLELDGGLRKWSGDSVWLIAHSTGFVFGGSSKSYMYKPDNPVPLYDSLDEKPKNLKSNVRAYRQINENWYIEFEWDD